MAEQQRMQRDRHLDLNDLNRDFAREKPAPAPPEREWGFMRGTIAAASAELLAFAAVMCFAPHQHLLAGILAWSGAALGLVSVLLARRR